MLNLEKVIITDNMDINIDQDVTFDLDVYHLPELNDLRNVHFKGRLFENDLEEIVLSGLLSGDIVVLDAISLDERIIKFSKEIEENLLEEEQSSKNNIDILDILWQNIVLEVPSRYTDITDYSKYQGDGWRLISEEELNYENNPFNVLKDIEKE